MFTVSDARQAFAPVAWVCLRGRRILRAVTSSSSVAATLALATLLLGLHQLEILLSDVIG